MVSIQTSQNKQSIANLTTDQKQTSGDIPPPLIGASTTVINDCIYVFGGRMASTRQMVNHLYILHLPTLVWTRHIASPDSALPPVPRYFHSACAYKERYIVLFGGMGSSPTNNKRAINHRQQQQQQIEEQLQALDDVNMFDIETMAWVEINVSPSIFKPLARYAHLSTLWDNDKLVIIGGQDITNHHINEMSVFDLQQSAWIHGSSINGLYDAYRTVAFCPQANNINGFGKLNAPFWKESDTIDKEEGGSTASPPVCIYSNYNFNDITRDLQSFYPLKSYSSPGMDFRNHTSNISSSYLPPGLRFPTGQLLGHYFILSGTFLNATQRGFQVWALNLSNLAWIHIDTGSILGNGSWNRGLVASSNKKFYILGNSHRDLKEDYSYRRINFEHVAVIDLEAFGIYTMPEESCSAAAQELGLAILNESGLSDVTIFTIDKQSISANSNILSERWPAFSRLLSSTQSKESRHLVFPETYAVTLAFLQFIYTDHLITAQQHQPQILSRLLILADMYKMDRLKQLATYGLHQLLTISTASMVYETATLTFQSALQIRALRIMMNAKRMLLQQQQQSDYLLSPSSEESSRQLSPSTSENSQRLATPPMTPKKVVYPNDKVGAPFPFTYH